ncbi:hypothetical protein Sango_2894000 [Sesamum angolense]|uniref:Retroviral polymerase SH3-like domain-containing protein n=1 Tax=Sesamum angolense TaxID=2727404 RepID=A0AAE1T5X2_9LAMI|nr:hypothetical protein Sango_2894000 [Sesamum angolense]
MTNNIQKQYDRLKDFPSIMLRMKEVYLVPDRHIRYVATKAFFGTKMATGSSVQSHGVKMLSLMEKLENLKAGLDNDTYIDVILQSLHPSFDAFIINYNMNGLEKSIHELINMLVQYEATTHKSALAAFVGEASTSKAKGKRVGRWKRKKGKKKFTTATASAKGAPAAASGKGKGKGNIGGSQWSKTNDVCMHCQEKRHWKRECPQPLQPSNLQVLERSRKLSKDEMILRLGNGKAVVAEAVGSNHIRIELKDYYYVPSMIKNTISILVLDNYGYGYALETAAKLLNVATFKTVPQMLYEIWHGKLASYKYLRVWGSSAHVKRLVGDKLDSRSSLCRFIEYPKEIVGYYFYDPSEQKTFVSRNAVFLEKGFSMDNGQDEVLLEESSESPQQDNTTSFKPLIPTNSVLVLHRSTRESRPPKRVDFEKTYSPVAMAKSIQMLLAIAAWDRSRRMLGLTQSSYIEKVLKRFKMENLKRGFLPMRHGIKLSKKQSLETDEELKKILDITYASANGSIQYVVQCTRPDVVYTLSATSFVFKLNGGVVAWKSSKQATTADSTTEAGYIAASGATKEAVLMKNYIQELGVVPSIVEPVIIFCDNNGAIAQVKKSRSHHRSKHILK